jgi:hypothetical protein
VKWLKQLNSYAKMKLNYKIRLPAGDKSLNEPKNDLKVLRMLSLSIRKSMKDLSKS